MWFRPGGHPWFLCYAMPLPPGQGHIKGCPTSTHKGLDKEMPSFALRTLPWEVAQGPHPF